MIIEKIKGLKEQLIQLAKKEYPKEMCGVIVNSNNNYQFIQCENVAYDPTELFEIDSSIWLGNYEIVAIVHSHTNGKNYLSKYDMKNQRILNLIWVLVCDDEVYEYRPIEPLLGRNFEFNKQDCYNLFRDLYMLAGSNHLPEFQYPKNWYEIGMNLYEDNLKIFDFEKVDKPEIGDVILFQIGSDIPNHAGVYLGGQYFIHHLIDSLSKRDIYGGYWQKHTHSFWRYKWKSKLNFMAILENLEMNLN